MERLELTAEQNETDLTTLLTEGAKVYGISLEENHIRNLMKFKDILKEWNEKINLTAIEEDREIIIKHFLDSFTIVPYINEYLLSGNGQVKSLKMIDIGTGGGFPGIPVKLVLDNIDMTLFDSLEKRIKFLNEATNMIGIKGIRAVHGRAEEFGVKPDYREKYDIATARAVANLPVLLEYCLPFVKVGGIFIAMKGSSTEEVDNSKKALQVLGGIIEDVKSIELPFSDMKRNIVIIKKVRQTPTNYPRKAGKPSKEPLL